MRILMLAQFYPPIIGGEERFAQDLSVAMAARGHDVVVVTQWQPGLADYELDQGVRVYRVHSSMERLPFLHASGSRMHHPSFPDPEVTAALRKIIQREQPEIVHAFNWIVYSFLPLKAWSKAKLVMSLCDHSFICAKKKLFYHEKACSGPGLTKCLSCAAAHYGKVKGTVTTLTNWGARQAEKLAVDMFLPVSYSVAVENDLAGSRWPFKVLPNFVADDIGTPRGDNADYIEQLPQGDFIMYAGAFNRNKGVDLLLEAYRHLQTTMPLVIIGYDTTENPVQTTNLPENVVVLKNWPNHAVLEAWRRSTIAVVPSIWAEPFGIVALEAMATGRPVVASNTGGLLDIVAEGETGLLVTPGDALALRDGLQMLVDNPALREKMGKAARERVKQFTASSVVPRYEQVYRRLLGAEVVAPVPDKIELPLTTVADETEVVATVS